MHWMEVMQGTDQLGRMSGKEFALLLPDTNAIRALDLAKRLRHRFADTPVYVQALR